jgi:hypothetical protein
MTDPYRLPVAIDPPKVYASCLRCDWAVFQAYANPTCEVRGLRKCAESNPDGDCDRFTPRRAWWRRLFGIGDPAL